MELGGVQTSHIRPRDSFAVNNDRSNGTDHFNHIAAAMESRNV